MGNSCECPTPPGGRVSCGPNQLAICRVKDGRVHSECIDPPASFIKVPHYDRFRSLARNNWALQVITGIERRSSQELSDRDSQVLTRRRYHNEMNGEIVTFTLPWEIQRQRNPQP